MGSALEEKIKSLYQRTLNREPTESELKFSVALSMADTLRWSGDYLITSEDQIVGEICESRGMFTIRTWSQISGAWFTGTSWFSRTAAMTAAQKRYMECNKI